MTDDLDPWDLPLRRPDEIDLHIRWDPPLPLCECSHHRHTHNHDRVDSPCTVSGCPCRAWKVGRFGDQHGHTRRVVLL